MPLKQTNEATVDGNIRKPSTDDCCRQEQMHCLKFRAGTIWASKTIDLVKMYKITEEKQIRSSKMKRERTSLKNEMQNDVLLINTTTGTWKEKWEGRKNLK